MSLRYDVCLAVGDMLTDLSPCEECIWDEESGDLSLLEENVETADDLHKCSCATQLWLCSPWKLRARQVGSRGIAEDSKNGDNNDGPSSK